MSSKLVYIPIKTQSKIAARKYGWLTKTPDESYFEGHDNLAILTGEKSNIIVLDIDTKDYGMEKWKEYIDEYGDPDTVQVLTPSGGYHYYFNYNDKIPTGPIGVGGWGIDIRSNGNYVLCPPSRVTDPKKGVEDGPYEWVNELDKTQIADVPESLFGWLTDLTINYNKKNKKFCDALAKKQKKNKENKKQTKNIEESPDEKLVNTNNKLIYYCGKDEVLSYLDRLPEEYCNNYILWLNVTNVLKSLKYFDIWDEWSQKSDSYDKSNNLDIWNNMNPFLTVNYLIEIINESLSKKDQIKYVLPTIDYKPIDEDCIECEKMVLVDKDYIHKNGKKFVDVGQYIGDNKTLILKADTGLGKTTSTARYVANQPHQVISIVSRVSMAGQHVKSFSQQNVELKHYEKGFKSYDNVVIQVDSIGKLAALKPNWSDTIIYIDEVNSLISYLLESSTLQSKRISVYHTLLKIINSCKIFICTDADISDTVFSIVHDIRDVDSTIYVDSRHKNYKKIVAYHYKDENEIIEKMIHNINNKKYFLCCFDTKEQFDIIIEKLRIECPKHKNDFIGYSKYDGNSDDFFNVNDNWIDKYVFYSPKIIYGIDFNPVNQTDVFVMCKGGTINSLQIAQQMTRCRFIKNIHLYLDPKNNQNKNNRLVQTSVEDLVEYYREFTSTYESFLTENHLLVREKFESTIATDLYSKLFFKNLFFNNVLNSNYIYHFLKICENKGFIIESVGTPVIMDKKTKKELKEKVKDNQNDRFINILEEQPDLEDVGDPFCRTIIKRKDILGLSWKEIVDNPEYQEIVKENNVFSNHLIFSKLIAPSKNKLDKFDERLDVEFKELAIKSVDSKILFCTSVEKKLGIDVLDINYDKHSDKFNNDLDCVKYFKTYDEIFATHKKQKNYDDKNTWGDLYHLLISGYKHLCGTKVFNYTRKKATGGGHRDNIPVYNINDDYVTTNINLISKRRNRIDSKFKKNNNIVINVNNDGNNNIVGKLF